ncbi:hypothetical protein PCASD_09968 [Puccinia coronata f. sp. avenae]|uniref:Uncharacterized protein n=1 Tax=Puccinia coronata f. sp. avenae TaxID=200324 RepID=A0A2N5UUT9_9BASI|nr:hypothetical protein PCASD_09968 [Puccinia coronata f. sp. avenae]
MEPDESTPEKPLPEWVLLEYFHMLQQVGIVGGKQQQDIQTGRHEEEGGTGSSTTKMQDNHAGGHSSSSSSQVFFSHLSHATCGALRDEINQRAGSVVGGGLLPSPIANILPAAPSSSPIAVERLGRCVCTGLSILELLKTVGVPLSEVCLLDPKATEELSPGDGMRFEWFLFGGILGDDPPRDRTAELRLCGFPSRHLGPIQMTTDTALAVTKKIVQDGHSLHTLPWALHPELVLGPREKVQMPFRYLAHPDGTPVMPDGMKELIRKDLDRAFEF